MKKSFVEHTYQLTLIFADELANVLLGYKGTLTSQEALKSIHNVVSRNKIVLEFFARLQEEEKRGFSLPHEHELVNSNANFGLSDNAYQLLDLGLRLLRTENPESVILDSRYAPRY